jgi:predicted nucleic acid-binding protein
MSYLLDTNIISELVAPVPNEDVIRWIEYLDPESVFLSVITIGELKRGIEKLPDSRRKKALADWLTGDLLIRFGDHILPIDVPVILTWGTLVAQMEAMGNPLPAIDSLLAATAAENGLTLATRNVRHFEASGISLFNPWEYEK